MVPRLQEGTGPESWGRVRGPQLQARLILQDGCDQAGVGDIFSQGSGWEQWGTEHPLGSKLTLPGRPGHRKHWPQDPHLGECRVPGPLALGLVLPK